TKNYRTGIEFDDPGALAQTYAYYDPIWALPEAGKIYWEAQGSSLRDDPSPAAKPMSA
ncbi:MAG: hypothetical protein H0V60_09060, partial [Actinobacteria bacterium]|nr:hypothetical protein [Actinomycetota bacterium]